MPVSNPTDSTEWTSYGTENVYLLAKKIEDVFAKFPQEILPVTMSGLQCEWVEIKNMIRKSSACLSTVNFIQKFVSLDSIVHQTDQASSEGVSEQMEVDSCLLIPTLLHLLNYT